MNFLKQFIFIFMLWPIASSADWKAFLDARSFFYSPFKAGASQDPAAYHLKKLSDPNPAVRAAALYHLADYMNASSDELNERVVFSFSDPAPEVRLKAVLAWHISGLTKPYMIYAAANLLFDSNPEVQKYVMIVLDQTFKSFIPPTRPSIQKALSAAALSEDRYMRLTAARLYRELTHRSYLNSSEKEDKMIELSRYLRSPNSRTREEAVLAFGDFLKTSSLLENYIADMLWDQNGEVRRAVAAVLGQRDISRLDVIDSLGKIIISDPNKDLRLEAVMAFKAQKNYPESLQISLASAARFDSEASIRYWAVRALGDIYYNSNSYEPKVLYALKQALSDSYLRVREEAISVLGRKPSQDSELLELLGKTSKNDSEPSARILAEYSFNELKHFRVQATACQKTFSLSKQN